MPRQSNGSEFDTGEDGVLVEYPIEGIECTTILELRDLGRPPLQRRVFDVSCDSPNQSLMICHLVTTFKMLSLSDDF